MKVRTFPGCLIAYRDRGTLTVAENKIEFVGHHDRVTLESVDDLSFETVGYDFINYWVRLKAGDTEVCFADGGWLGWRGRVANGTRGILRAIIARFPEDDGQASESNKSTL